MVDALHAKDIGLLLEIPANPTHAQDPQRLPLGIVAQRRSGIAPPLALSQSQHGRVETPQRAQHEEDAHVGRRVVHGRRGVGDADRGITPGAGVDIDLVVAGSVVGAELEGFGQGVDEFFVPDAGDVDAGEGPVGDEDVVEASRVAFLDEVGAVGGFGGDEICYLGERVPGFVGAERRVCMC